MDRRSVSRNWLPLLILAVLLAAVVAVIIVRLQAAPVPLERDEGEYALMGQLILDGVPPYLEAANMKLPGTYYAYSAILAVFGQTVTGVRIGLMIVNLLSTVFLFLLARRLIGSAGAALAGAAFIIMSSDTSVLGLFAHATQFVVMFALAGTWLLQESSGSKHRLPILWGTGLCFGLAFLMKQSGVFFALFGFLWLLYGALRQRPIARKRSLLESATMAGGILIPYAVVLALMASEGVLDRFWLWTFDYARTYVSQVDLKTGIEFFESGIIPIIQSNPVIWSMALAG
ncbi:MAG: glycosyltransferase family 39 protein, partial [Syntrophobacteraceae bacterium]